MVRIIEIILNIKMFIAIVIILIIISVILSVLSLRSFHDKSEIKKVSEELSRGKIIFQKNHDSSSSESES